ncbi:hypothetical protein H6P81_003921 [Aristolochia fimbriata]|uniref:F-box domain-containing protein n=1 Tax=Aristolochia fimbriata TaxID=158543 RepID=A0AAV7FE53_ARIFI|nr:hypothetical protein H6P81_003921 [Aristolochia fimbriata]
MAIDQKTICMSTATSTDLAFYLLPSELLQDIFLRLALPDILRLKSVSRNLNSFVSRDDFRQIYDRKSTADPWIFLFKKRSPPRDSLLRGFSHRSRCWCSIPIPRAFHGHDLYFLTTSGDFFLFASNYHGDLLAFNLRRNTLERVPPAGPLGPRGTSSWRRSSLKLIAGPPGSDAFSFLFADLYRNRPFLFRYSSATQAWTWKPAQEAADDGAAPRVLNGRVVLSVVHNRGESVMVSADPAEIGDAPPAVLRPRFGAVGNASAVGLVSGSSPEERLHVYGDGKMVVVRSDGGKKVAGGRIFRCVEVWGLTADGRGWEFVTRVPQGLLERVKKPYRAMMGCLEERNGVLSLVLLSNYKGSWDIIWLSYGIGNGDWTWVPLPDCGTKDLNMAGIAISSGLCLLTDFSVPSSIVQKPARRALVGLPT